MTNFEPLTVKTEKQ